MNLGEWKLIDCVLQIWCEKLFQKNKISFPVVNYLDVWRRKCQHLTHKLKILNDLESTNSHLSTNSCIIKNCQQLTKLQLIAFLFNQTLIIFKVTQLYQQIKPVNITLTSRQEHESSKKSTKSKQSNFSRPTPNLFWANSCIRLILLLWFRFGLLRFWLSQRSREEFDTLRLWAREFATFLDSKCWRMTFWFG
jgi:hypothetical protein